MAAAGGSQCGYCTPGFVVSLFAEHYRRNRVGPCDTAALAGNLCRCTGYRPIRDAAQSLGAHRSTSFVNVWTDPRQIWRPFRFTGILAGPAASIAECLALLDDHPAAKLVAGATDLGVESNLRVADGRILSASMRFTELREYSSTATSVTIGAALTLNEIGERLDRCTRRVSRVAVALRLAAHPQSRHASAAISPPRRPSATPPRFFSRSTPMFTSQDCQVAGLWLSRLSSPDYRKTL